MPDALRAVLSHSERLIGFERPPRDVFHSDPDNLFVVDDRAGQGETEEDRAVGVFLSAVLAGTPLRMAYGSREDERRVRPLGLFWDRDFWYLAAASLSGDGKVKLYRSDRVAGIVPEAGDGPGRKPFDIREMLGHRWLKSAMESWRERDPAVVRMTRTQAERLQRDWYYGHAQYTQEADGTVLMTVGEGDPELIAQVVRWLGPGAEIVSPVAWRERVRRDMEAMAAAHSDVPDEGSGN